MFSTVDEGSDFGTECSDFTCELGFREDFFKPKFCSGMSLRAMPVAFGVSHIPFKERFRGFLSKKRDEKPEKQEFSSALLGQPVENSLYINSDEDGPMDMSSFLS